MKLYSLLLVAAFCSFAAASESQLDLDYIMSAGESAKFEFNASYDLVDCVEVTPGGVFESLETRLALRPKNLTFSREKDLVTMSLTIEDTTYGSFVRVFNDSLVGTFSEPLRVGRTGNKILFESDLLVMCEIGNANEIGKAK